MTIDVYQPCACGSGKKIKFCCCRDITGELGKVVQKLDAEQRVAALEQVSKVIEKHGNRAALLAIKAIAQLQLGNDEGAGQTVATFIAEHPHNSVALALSATVKAGEADPRSGIEPLQRALENMGESIPAAVYESIGALAEGLLVAGHVMAARAHYLLQAGLSASEDEDVNKILARLGQSAQLPLLLKQTPELDECPQGSPLKAEFDAALDLAGKGTWLAAAEKFTELSKNAPDVPSLHRNLGVLYCCLGKNDEAVAALHRYAASNGEVDLDDKVEAEALAQLIDPVLHEGKIPVVSVKYPIRDVEKLIELFNEDKRIDQLPVDTSQFGKEDAPPPKAVFSLLDRPLPETGVDIKRQDIPNVLGDLLVYGRETDREARLEAVLSQTENFEQTKKVLTDVAGEVLDQPTETETIGDISAVESVLTWNWRMPHDVPVDHRETLISEQRRDVIVNKWPATQLPSLGGKTPNEVKDDPAFRVPLLAAVWLVESSGAMQLWKVDYNELRSQLGLPVPEPIDPTGLDVAMVPLVRLSRLAVDKLTDSQLITAFQAAIVYQVHNATRSVGNEILARESLADKIHKPNVLGALAKTAQDSQTALDFVHKAQEAARERNESPASFLIAELPLQIRRGAITEFQNLVHELETRHIREPGVAQAVTSILVQFGLISPDDVNAALRAQAAAGGPLGRQRGMPGAGPAAVPGLGPGVVPGAATPMPPAGPAEGAGPASDGLWTPNGSSPAGQPKADKPKIWMPGMD